MSVLSLLAQTSSDFGGYSTTYDPYTYSTTNTSDAAAAGLAIGVILFFLVIGLALYVFMAICMMKIFKKAGRQDAWAAWIPIYNMFVYYEVAGRPGWWAFLGFIPIVGGLISIITIIIGSIDMAKSFGKSEGFGWLLALIPIVGQPMLAFGDATYKGPAGPDAKAAPAAAAPVSPSDPAGTPPAPTPQA